MKPRIQRSDEPRTVLTALADTDTRAILAATGAEPRSVAELVDHCEIPTATAYRKVDDLVEAGLLEERVRIRPQGRNVSEYVLGVNAITVTLDRPGADPSEQVVLDHRG